MSEIIKEDEEKIEDIKQTEKAQNSNNFENFWYYNKTKVILGTILLIGIIMYVYPIITEPKSDGTVTLLTQPYLYEVSEHIGEVFSEHAKDLNADGKEYVKIIPIQSDPNGDYGMDSTMYQVSTLTVTSHLNSCENFLYLLDETNYFILKERGVEFVDLSQLLGNTIACDFDNELYSLSKTNYPSLIGIDLLNIMYFGLIDFSSQSIENQNDSEKIKAYENDMSLLLSLIGIN